MSLPIPRIENPELFFGFVAPIGTELTTVTAAFRAFFARMKYRVVEIKVTDWFEELAQYVRPDHPLVPSSLAARTDSYTLYGNQIRRHFQDNAIMAVLAVSRIVQQREAAAPADTKYARTVYLLHQFKRQEEIDLLRSVYGPLFFQVSIYSRRGSRLLHLCRRIAEDDNSADLNQYRADAEKLIQRDENERDQPHGQRVGRIFHHADVIFNLDKPPHDRVRQIERFCELIFSSNTISPTRMEFGMFAAKAAALRTLDLSRQVGAAIFSGSGDIVALGANEVPKGGGGSYWSDEPLDDREYVRGFDSNQRMKQEVLTELFQAVAPDAEAEQLLQQAAVRDSKFMDALEYGRIVHAEMAAITDAARLGRPLAGATLYCTTFPCHLCAKHIVASGIDRVIFLEPYPKSLAPALHSDSIEVEGNDRGDYQSYPATRFEHFSGITPRRYSEFFERGSRKDKRTGMLQPYEGGRPHPMVQVTIPSYAEVESYALYRLRTLLGFRKSAGDG